MSLTPPKNGELKPVDFDKIKKENQVLDIPLITQHMHALRAQVPLFVIKTEQEYDHAVNVLNELLDAGGADEHHPLVLLVTLLSDFIANYEDK